MSNAKLMSADIKMKDDSPPSLREIHELEARRAKVEYMKEIVTLLSLCANIIESTLVEPETRVVFTDLARQIAPLLEV